MLPRAVCVISGPTASGKTGLSLQIAREFQGVIVNFDSLLFYKELNIGTAKPTHDELREVPHHMVNTHSVKNPINAADYIKEALPLIDQVHSQGKLAILVGGSGFYLQALLYGMFSSGTSSKEITERSEKLYQASGITPFLEELKKCDPASFERYHENDHYRIRRAVEHFWQNQTPFSQAREGMGEKRKQGPLFEKNWNLFHAHLDLPKDEHWQIICQRTSQMIKNGLIQEVEGLLKQGLTGEEKPLQSIGYKEVQTYLKGGLESIEDLEERISINTRKLAKAQRTWFKKVEKREYHPLKETKKVLSDLRSFLR